MDTKLAVWANNRFVELKNKNTSLHIDYREGYPRFSIKGEYNQDRTVLGTLALTPIMLSLITEKIRKIASERENEYLIFCKNNKFFMKDGKSIRSNDIAITGMIKLHKVYDKVTLTIGFVRDDNDIRLVKLKDVGNEIMISGIRYLSISFPITIDNTYFEVIGDNSNKDLAITYANLIDKLNATFVTFFSTK